MAHIQTMKYIMLQRIFQKMLMLRTILYHLISLENGLKTETEYFVKTLMTPSVQAMLQTLYTDRQKLRN